MACCKSKCIWRRADTILVTLGTLFIIVGVIGASAFGAWKRREGTLYTKTYS